MVDVNTKSEGLSKQINEKSKFFIIKSFSEEDVHKSIKYNVWSSTKTGNQTLNNAYKKAKEEGGDVYLIFSTNGSGRFVGITKMKNEVDFDKMFIYWTQDGKWNGMMNVEWVFIKDVPFKEFRNIIILMKDGQVKPLSNSRDTQEIPFLESKKIFEIIENYNNSNTILEHFEYYDLRQENYEKSNQTQNYTQQR